MRYQYQGFIQKKITHKNGDVTAPPIERIENPQRGH